MHKFSKHKGFTLIEMIIVLAIIAILVGAAFPRLSYYQERNKEQELQNQEYLVNKGIKQYYAFTGQYPGCSYDTTTGLLSPAPAINGELKLKDELAKKTGINIDTDNFDFSYYLIDGGGAYLATAVRVSRD